jgi:hypothetical protein
MTELKRQSRHLVVFHSPNPMASVSPRSCGGSLIPGAERISQCVMNELSLAFIN